ncbi:7303_t:CDS:1, partial [Racocetra fulgida]
NEDVDKGIEVDLCAEVDEEMSKNTEVSKVILAFVLLLINIV